MKSIKVDQWGGYEFFFDPNEVAGAEGPDQILECLKDSRGINPYSPMRCKALAETREGKILVAQIRRICEGGGDKGKGPKKGKTQETSN